MILVDSSVWVQFLRAVPGASRDEVRRLLSDDPREIAMTEPIAMELLGGAVDDLGWQRLARLVDGLPQLSFDPVVDFRSAARLYRSARATGRTIRSWVDCLIAAVALRHDVVLLHRDADFEVLAQISGLRTASLP